SESSGSAEPPLRIGPYIVLRELGRGGFGVVFLAYDARHDSEVALKVPRPEVLSQAAVRERFLRESTAMKTLLHPHVVRVLDVGADGPINYLASEYCPLGSLADLLQRKELVLSPTQAARLIQELALAVDYVHSQGVLHRDLKPSNVLLRANEPPTTALHELPFVPLLADFGLAKLVEHSLDETATSLLLGTPLYMAPEQATCQHHLVGPATDVYSLGVILYELLTGRPPFIGPGLLGVLNEVRSAAPPALSKFNPLLPRDLEQICLKCLAKEPEDRYHSAAELAADLERFALGQTVRAKPPGIRRQFAKWSKQPQRMLDAGIWSTVLNLGIVVWMLGEIPYLLWAPGLNFDRHAVVTTSVQIAVLFVIPKLITGWFTIRQRRWAMQLGGGLAFANLTFSLLGMFGVMNSFGDLYDAVPGLRVIMFGLLSSFIVCELLLYAIALQAKQFADRNERRSAERTS
ncbi:MAG TPA: serine/threonine-protein kinase, partial [Pirellulaceae bacterium]|nr:serine/threonine-protein kinase [Pirellulaceae bacterium]